MIIFNGRSENLLDGYLNISTTFSLPGKTKIVYTLVYFLLHYSRGECDHNPGELK